MFCYVRKRTAVSKPNNRRHFLNWFILLFIASPSIVILHNYRTKDSDVPSENTTADGLGYVLVWLWAEWPRFVSLQGRVFRGTSVSRLSLRAIYFPSERLQWAFPPE
jgi:hypothetical protein